MSRMPHYNAVQEAAMRALMILYVACLAAFGQAKFEVASVRPADPARSAVDFRVQPGGRLTIVNLTPKEMIQEAYGVKYYQLEPEPSWIDRERFDITAKAEGEPTRKEMMQMLQALLAERFHLQVHQEAREGNVFRLQVARNGPKLKASSAERAFIRTYRNTPPQLPGVSYTWVGEKATMAMLADNLNGHLRSPVADDTKLRGEFDFKVTFATNDDPETGPSIFVALQQELGLKLEAGKGPVMSLVIDRIERPSGN
jgi:uncharacterized protein (TIGR03435 family)